MSKNILITLIIVVIIAAALLIFPPIRKENLPEKTISPPPVGGPPPAAEEAPPVGGSPTAKEQIVEITAQGFSPSTLVINPGTTVRFVNRDTAPHWPASGVHPIHQLCPGFDALQGLNTGESYTFTFTEAKTCPMHDHLNPQIRGSIVVQ